MHDMLNLISKRVVIKYQKKEQEQELNAMEGEWRVRSILTWKKKRECKEKGLKGWLPIDRKGVLAKEENGGRRLYMTRGNLLNCGV